MKNKKIKLISLFCAFTVFGLTTSIYAMKDTNKNDNSQKNMKFLEEKESAIVENLEKFNKIFKDYSDKTSNLFKNDENEKENIKILEENFNKEYENYISYTSQPFVKTYMEKIKNSEKLNVSENLLLNSIITNINISNNNLNIFNSKFESNKSNSNKDNDEELMEGHYNRMKNFLYKSQEIIGKIKYTQGKEYFNYDRIKYFNDRYRLAKEQYLNFVKQKIKKNEKIKKMYDKIIEFKKEIENNFNQSLLHAKMYSYYKDINAYETYVVDINKLTYINSIGCSDQDKQQIFEL